jgi:hypothetical protein
MVPRAVVVTPTSEPGGRLAPLVGRQYRGSERERGEILLDQLAVTGVLDRSERRAGSVASRGSGLDLSRDRVCPRKPFEGCRHIPVVGHACRDRGVS